MPELDAGVVVIEVQGDFDGFQDELAGQDGDVEASGGRMGGLLKAGILAGVAGVGALLMEGITQAISLDADQDRLQAALGLTDEQSAAAGRVAGELYMGAYGESVADVNAVISGALGEGLASLDDEGALETLTAQTFDFATAMGVDAVDALGAAGQLVRTGLAEDGTEALDLLTRGFQSNANLGGDLLDVLDEYGTTFSDLGLDGSEAIGLIDQALAAGVPNADFAADAFREFGIIVTEGTDEARAAAAGLGIDFADLQARLAAGDPTALTDVIDALGNIEDPLARDQAAIALFGTQVEDLGSAWIAALDPATAGLENVSGAAAETSAVLGDNLGSQIEQFKRRVWFSFVQFLEERVLPILEDLAHWWQANWPAMRETLQQWVAWLQTNVGPIVEQVIHGVIDTVAQLRAWWEENGPAIQEAVGRVVDTLIALWERFDENILSVLREVFEFLQEWVQNVVQMIDGLIDLVTALINGDWKAAWEALKQIVDAIWSNILALVDTAIDILYEYVRAIGPVLMDLGAAAFGALVDVVRTKTDDVVRFFLELPLRILAFEAELAAAAVGWIASAAADAPGKLWDLITAIGSWIIDHGVPAMLDFGEDLGGAVVDGIVDILQGIGGLGRDVAGDFVQAIKDLINTQVIDRINGLLEISFNTHIPGVGTIDIDPRDIPHLAAGAYTTDPMLAMVGDAGAEWVLPDRLLRDVIREESGGGGSRLATVYLDGEPVWRNVRVILAEHDRAAGHRELVGVR